MVHDNWCLKTTSVLTLQLYTRVLCYPGGHCGCCISSSLCCSQRLPPDEEKSVFSVKWQHTVYLSVLTYYEINRKNFIERILTLFYTVTSGCITIGVNHTQLGWTTHNALYSSLFFHVFLDLEFHMWHLRVKSLLCAKINTFLLPVTLDLKYLGGALTLFICSILYCVLLRWLLRSTFLFYVFLYVQNVLQISTTVPLTKYPRKCFHNLTVN